MLTLALLRHAKSCWEAPGLDDFDRPLNARGEAAAPLMGQAMAERKFRPEFILCSPAKRTRETLELASPKLSGGKPRIMFDERLYLASAAELLRVVQETPAGPDAVLVIGHNPGLHAFALNLAGEGGAADIGRMTAKFPTAALALLTFETQSWGKVRQGDGRLTAFLTPKERA